MRVTAPARTSQSLSQPAGSTPGRLESAEQDQLRRQGAWGPEAAERATSPALAHRRPGRSSQAADSDFPCQPPRLLRALGTPRLVSGGASRIHACPDRSEESFYLQEPKCQTGEKQAFSPWASESRKHGGDREVKPDGFLTALPPETRSRTVCVYAFTGQEATPGAPIGRQGLGGVPDELPRPGLPPLGSHFNFFL